MSDFYSETRPKARKHHTCNECGETITPGEVYVRRFYAGDSVDSDKICMNCKQWNDAAWDFIRTFGIEEYAPAWGYLEEWLRETGAEEGWYCG